MHLDYIEFVVYHSRDDVLRHLVDKDTDTLELGTESRELGIGAIWNDAGMGGNHRDVPGRLAPEDHADIVGAQFGNLTDILTIAHATDLYCYSF